jgi:ParB family chromosome partitioning protein
MQLKYLELSQLIISRANMRAKHKNDFADLIPSVRVRGVLVPLLVRPNDEPDMYEIVAGRRRYLAASAVAKAPNAPTIVPCAIMEPGDDAAALEASLIENVARLDADEVTQWETFARLIKEKRSVEDIAATFGLDERVVRRVLALGNLLPRIRGLYRAEQIDAATVRHLTMATTPQQREWLALFDSTDSYAPTGRVLKEWLFGGSAIATSVALFDLADYTAPITADLFDEHSYFTDAALFWNLQRKAIEAKRDAYRADGWSDVVVLDDGQYFERWTYDKRARTKGGRVYIAVSMKGEVEVHEGYLPRKDAERADRKESSSAAEPRPELTTPLGRYVDLHRHAAMRARLIGHPWLALRVMVAHAIARSSLWNLQCERQQAGKPETEQSVIASKAQAVFNEKRAAVLVRLGLDPDCTLIAARGRPPLPAILELLTDFTDEEVLDLIPIVMGESIEASSDVVETIGCLLAIDTSEPWEADEAFFTLLRDRRVIAELLVEVAGQEVAQANADAPLKVQKAILHDCIQGENGRAKVENWVPRWLRFPATTYLEQQAAEPSGEPEAKPSDQLEEPTGPEEADIAA